MTLLQILEKAIQKEYTDYSEALDDLKSLNLPYEEYEKYSTMLNKMLGKGDKIFRNPSFYFTGILNEKYFAILQETISLIRDGLHSPEIAQELWDKYMLSPALITYFVNEGLSIVRMNTLQPEEIASIGEAYHRLAAHLEQKGSKEKPAIKSEAEDINAQDINNTEIFSDDENY